jgi:hypothetical protein
MGAHLTGPQLCTTWEMTSPTLWSTIPKYVHLLMVHHTLTHQDLRNRHDQFSLAKAEADALVSA